MTTIALHHPSSNLARQTVVHTEESKRLAEQGDKEIDRILVDRARQGDRRAYDFLVVKYQHRVAALIRRYTQNPQDISDLSQDTFIRAYQALGKFRGDSAFYSWLYRIAINTALSHVGSQHRTVSESDLSHDEQLHDWVNERHSVAGPEPEHDAEELHSVVQVAMAELPSDMAQALRHREWDGMSYEAIADAMQVPVGTVRSRIFRAREALEQRIRAWQASGESS